MVMDFLRSCYKQRLRYLANDPTQTEVGTWYFCRSSAKEFPYAHAFGSPTWDTFHPTPTVLGFSATSPRSYYNGRRLNNSDGTTFAGPASWFLHGAPLPVQLPRGADGTPIECLHPPFGLVGGGQVVPVVAVAGGKEAGGQLVQSVIPGVPCSNCGAVTPLTISVTLSGFAGVYSDYNGTFQLVQQSSPCTWFLALAGTHSISANRSPGGVWSVALTGSIFVCIYSGTSPDCVNPATLNQTFSVAGGDPTCTITAP